jgi:hypothetical protein
MSDEINPIDRPALMWLASQPGGSVRMSAAEFGRNVRWSRQKAGRRLDVMSEAGLIVRRAGIITLNKERTIIRTEIIRDAVSAPDTDAVSATAEAGHGRQKRDRTVRGFTPLPQAQTTGLSAPELPPSVTDNRADIPIPLPPIATHLSTSMEGNSMGLFSRSKPVSVPDAAAPLQPANAASLPAPKYNFDVAPPQWDVAPPVVQARPIPGQGRASPRQAARGSTWDNGIVFAAVLIMLVTAYASVNGMTTLFAGAATFALVFGIAIEIAKFCACGWIGEHYEEAPAWHTLIVVVGIVACASLNAISVHSLLMNAHFGSRSEIIASAETKNAEAAGRIEVEQGRIADFDKRLAQIDSTIAEATRRGKVKGAADLIQSQQKARAAIAGERDKAAGELAALKTQRVQTTAQSKASEETSLRFLAETFGISGGAETVMKYFASVAVAVGDPFAIFLIFASGARRRRMAGA